MLEVLKALEPVMDSLSYKDSCEKPRPRPINHVIIKPFVLILQYNQYNEGPLANIDFANEFTEVLHGIYNTRNGRSTAA
jgi:hypothetical protein